MTSRTCLYRICVYFERSYELCYRRADHSHNRIIPPQCPVIQHYNSITQERGPMAVRMQLVKRKEGTEIVRGSGQLYTLLPNTQHWTRECYYNN